MEDQDMPLVVMNRTSLWRPFPDILPARFIRRINRFLVECELDSRTVRAFLPNPGRLMELLLPGRQIYLTEDPCREGRTTRFTMVAVFRDGHPLLLHTHKTNEVVEHLLKHGLVPGLEDATIVKREVKRGHSRFDFLLEDRVGDIILEVKSCTLVDRNVAMFPDAVTARGARHIQELAGLSVGQTRSVVVFVVHWPFPSVFMPDYHTDLNFARTMLALRDSVRMIPLSISWLADLSLSPEVRLLDIPWSYVEREARDGGSYILILRLPADTSIEVGKLGRIFFRKGFYLYVGSAMNNLTRRMERHRRLRKRMHWHVDYLRPHADVHALLPIRSTDRLECTVARAVEGMSQSSIPGFGCSDCTCDSHLFAVADDPLESPKLQELLQHFRMGRYRPDPDSRSRFQQ